MNPSSVFFQQLTTLLKLLESVLSGVVSNYVARTAQAMLTALLNLLMGEFASATIPSPIRESRSTIIEQSFRQLLKQHYKVWKQPALYAAQLAVTVSHLNDTVKAITGATVSAHIQRHSIIEAKRLLYFTGLSIKEIGYAVGYDEPVYFGKLFKKLTGVTPVQFRKKFRD